MSRRAKHKPKCAFFLVLLTLILGLASLKQENDSAKFNDLAEYIKPTSASYCSISAADEH